MQIKNHISAMVRRPWKQQSITLWYKYVTCLFIMILAANNVSAYQIFPGLAATIVNKTAIHEQMTLAAQSCANSQIPDKDLTCEWPDFDKYITYKLPKLTKADWALVHGVQWPDNPLRNATKLNGMMSFGGQMLTDCAGYKGSTGGLVCKSHYFDMQFLHAMSTRKGQPADESREQIIQWLHFVYKSLLNPKILDSHLGTLMKGNDFNKIAFAIAPQKDKKIDMQGWKGWQLFSYKSTRYIFKNRAPDLRDYPTEFLLGVMLHTIQDSFSESHTQRGYKKKITSRVTCKPINEFYTYPGQDSTKHDTCDEAPILSTYCTKQKGDVDDPILASAHLIRMARSRTPWSKVETYLRSHVFSVSDHPLRSSNGPYK